MEFNTATIVEYAVIPRWAPEPFVSLEMAWALIKGYLPEIDARY